MKVFGLDGKKYTLNINEANFSDYNRSEPHLVARILIKQNFPKDIILEEITLPGPQKLIVDFLLPLRKLIVECHGIQHYEFVPFFHKSLTEFAASKDRDAKKKEWCKLNNFIYLELDTRNQEAWNDKLSHFYEY